MMPPVLIPAALSLAVYSGLAFFEAARLRAADSWTLVAAGGLIALAAAFMMAKHLWAYLFDLSFLGLSSVGYGAVAAYEAATGQGVEARGRACGPS